MDTAEPDNDEPTGTSRARPAGGGVQSLHRATRILEIVAHAPKGIGLAELCKEIGLPNSTVFHLAKTMVTLGLLRQETDSKRYRVGRMLFSLAAGALDELELLAVAAPILADLAERSGETSHVGVRVGREAVIIGRHDGPSAIRVAERIGAPRPLHATSMGKVLLAQLTDEQVRAYLKAGPLRRVTARTVTDPEALLAIVDEVRLSGVAFDDGEYLVDGRCIAAPVRDFRGGVVCAIGISAPTWRLGIDRVAATEAHVRQAAREFSLALGATDPAEASRRSTPRFTREP